jgi:hypothetical protein
LDQIGLKGQLPSKEKWYSREKVEEKFLIGSSYNFSSILVLFGWKNWRNWLAGPF